MLTQRVSANLQPVAVGIDNSDPANNGRKIRIMVAEGRNREARNCNPKTCKTYPGAALVKLYIERSSDALAAAAAATHRACSSRRLPSLTAAAAAAWSPRDGGKHTMLHNLCPQRRWPAAHHAHVIMPQPWCRSLTSARLHRKN